MRIGRTLPPAAAPITFAEILAGLKGCILNNKEKNRFETELKQYFGMKYIYLEAGSGAQQPVPVEMVKKVKEIISVPLIVGGGIRSAKTAQELIKAGADYIVLGSIIERSKEQFEVVMKGVA